MGDAVEYRDVPGREGFRVGSDGSFWTRWKRSAGGPKIGSFMYMSDEWRRLNVYLRKGRAIVAFGKGDQTALGRLILSTFIGPCPSNAECCHDPDNDPMNCSLSNLRWGTSKENTGDQRRHGTLVGGERHGMAKLSNDQIDEIRLLASRKTMTQRQIAGRYGISQGHVSMVVNGKMRTESSHNGRGLKNG